MYQGVLTSAVCFAIGCCAPAMAQCTTCGNNYTGAVVENYQSYPIEGQYVETQPMNGQFVEGQIVQSYPVEGQWTPRFESQ